MTVHDIRFSIPNMISFGRILAVPVMVWLILDDNLLTAFWVFVAASLSDAVDGFVAKKFDAETVLGGFLDPIADKALLISVFITLGQAGVIAVWLVILIVFRDALIFGGAYLYQLFTQSLTMQPLLSSKINTAAQFILVATVLGLKGFAVADGGVITAMVYIVALTTFLSGAQYVINWSRRAAAMERSE